MVELIDMVEPVDVVGPYCGSACSMVVPVVVW